MKPTREEYKILYMHQTYFVLTPYDLYFNPCLKIIGWGHKALESAERYKEDLFNSDMKEYLRLKELGRSFPDNS